jgi:hypothetical protein
MVDDLRMELRHELLFLLLEKVCIMVLGRMFVRTIWVEFLDPLKRNENRKTFQT